MSVSSYGESHLELVAMDVVWWMGTCLNVFLYFSYVHTKKLNTPDVAQLPRPVNRAILGPSFSKILSFRSQQK